MGVLDNKIQAGQPVTVNADYHNELVDRLADRGADQVVRVEASTTKAVIRKSDDALVPSGVVLSDETDWRGLTYEQLYIAVSVTGVGEVADATIDPGGTTTWTWAAADWTTSTFPAQASVTFTPYRLTADITLSSVATSGSLPGSATTDDRIQVRDTRAIYRWTGSAWAIDPGPNWSALPARRVDITVEQGFDPGFTNQLTPHVVPEADFIRLRSGIAAWDVADFTAFPAAVTSVSRAVVAEYLDLDGDPVAPDEESTPHSPGLTVTGGVIADWLAATDRSFTVEAIEPGLVRLTTTYTYSTGGGNLTVDVVRKITVGAPQRHWRTAEDTPATPAFQVTAGNGQTSFKLGTSVALSAFTDNGAAAFDTTLPTTSSLSRSLAARLATTGTSDPEAHRAFAAAETLRSVLASGVNGKVKSYDLTLRPSGDDDQTDLLTIKTGQMVYLPSGAMKVTEILSDGYEMAEDGVTYQLRVRAYGLFEGAVDEIGWVSSNADLVTVSMTFGYGTLADNNFPTYSFTSDRMLTPVAAMPQYEVPLPTQQPTALSDRWYVKANVTALWPGGEVSTSSYDWAAAEVVPTGSPAMTLTRDGDAFNVMLSGTADNFFGKLYWSKATDLPGTNAAAADALAGAQPVPSRSIVALTMDQYTDARVLTLDGHLRSRGGSASPHVLRVVSQSYTPVGASMIVDTVAPTNPAPVTNGLYHTDGTDLWVSANAAWVKLTPAADNMYTKNEVYAKTETYSKSEVDTSFYTKNWITDNYLTKANIIKVDSINAGSEITGDKVLTLSHDGVVYKVLGELVGTSIVDFSGSATVTVAEFANVFVDHIQEIALFDAATGGTEITGNGYVRATAQFEDIGTTFNTVENPEAFTFPVATADWGSVFLRMIDGTDSLTELVEFASPVTVLSGQKLRVPARSMLVYKGPE